MAQRSIGSQLERPPELVLQSIVVETLPDSEQAEEKGLRYCYVREEERLLIVNSWAGKEVSSNWMKPATASPGLKDSPLQGSCCAARRKEAGDARPCPAKSSRVPIP